MGTLRVVAVAIAAFVPAAAQASEALASNSDGAPVRSAPADAEAKARPADLARADALFRVALELRASGFYSDACPRFAETQRLLPGIGVTLYLADCYEHLGHVAWAWTEFRRAERLARERQDHREGVAHLRAAALEPKLKRLTIAVSKTTQQDGLEVALDGASVPPDRWNVALASDAGDHVLEVHLRSQAVRTIRLHIDPDAPALTVPVDEPSPAAGAPSSQLPPTTLERGPATASGPALAEVTSARPVSPPGLEPSSEPASGTAPSAPSTPSTVSAPAPAAPSAVVPGPTPGDGGSGGAAPGSWLTVRRRSAIELGLLGGGVASIGLGAGLLAVQNHAIETDHTSSAGTASSVAFALGGAALVSAVVLYLAAPGEKSSALVVSPTPLVGGGGAVVRGSF